MKSKKRLLAFFLTVVLIITGVPLSAAAETSNETATEEPAEITPILHYDMKETGDTVIDSAGDYDGTLVGSTAWVGGVDGYGVHVAGGEDYISVPREAFMQSADVTISAWVKLDSIKTWTTIMAVGNASTNNMIMAVQGNPSGKPVGYTVGLRQSGQSEVRIAAGNCMNPTVNEWAMITYTQTGSTACLYLNGERVQQITNMTGTIKGILEANESATVRIGDNHIYGDPSMVGTISDVKVYGTALTAEDIRAEYEEKQSSGTVLHYEMEESGETVVDSAGSYDGSLNGTTAWVEGLNGQAVHVAGGADYIGIPREALMQSDDVTFSTWVKLDSIKTWTTILGVGSSRSNYMLLSVMGNPNGNSVGVTAAIKENGGTEYRVSASSGVNPVVGDWALVTYAQSGSVATLYLNGEQVAQITNMAGSIKGVLEAAETADVRVGANQIFPDPSVVGAFSEVIIKNRTPIGDELAEEYQAHIDAELLVHYDMNETGDAVVDSVNDYDGTLSGNTSWEDCFEGYSVHLGGANNDYIGVPREALLQSDAMTFSAWINLDKVANWTTILSVGNNTSNYMIFAVQGDPYTKKVGLTTAVKENNGAEIRVSAETTAQPTVGKWALVTYTQIGKVGTIYLNGEQVAQTTGMLGTIKGVLEASAAADIRIGDNQIYGDPSMAAYVTDVKIYKGAVTADVLKAEVAEKAELIALANLNNAADGIDLGDLSAVKTDLNLPTETANGSKITWKSSDEEIISAEGKVTLPDGENRDIVLTAVVSSDETSQTVERTFIATVLAKSDKNIAAWAAAYTQRYVDYLINDGYELLTGENLDAYSGETYDCEVAWELTEGDAVIEDGRILKTKTSKERQPIKLKAVVTKGEASEEVFFENVTLIDEYAGYVMSFFGGNDGLQTLHLGFSYDGFNWKSLNNGMTVHTPEGGSGVVRDPYILRKKDGSFCVVATNNWSNPTIYLWDSEDLVTYTNERVSTVAYAGEVGLTGARSWAPEAVYDPIKDEYTVFWSDPSANGGNGNIYGNTSKDLEEFSHPFEFFTTDYTIIDASITKWHGEYYMVFKDETGNNAGTAGGKVIYMAKSDSLDAGTFKQYTGAITEILVEGPFMFKLNNEEKWVHYYDYFNEHKFGVSTTTDLASGEWEFLGKSTTMPTTDVRHGGVVPVTQKELDRLLEGYDYREPVDVVVDIPVASYDMSVSDGKLVDTTGNGFDAPYYNFTEADFQVEGEGEEADNVLVFDGTDKYAALPSGMILEESFAVEATFKTSTIANSWIWCFGSKMAGNAVNYVFVSPRFKNSYDTLRAGIKNASTERLFSGSGSLGTDDYTTIRMEFAGGIMKLYKDGELLSTMNSGYSIQEILTNGTSDGVMGYIGKSLFNADAPFTGTLTQLTIYRGETEDESKAELQELVDAAKLLAETDYTKEFWPKFVKELADAEEELASTQSDIQTIEYAKVHLTKAMEALVKLADKTALQAAVDAEKEAALAEEDYTPETWAVYTEALANGEALLAEEEVTDQEAVDAAAEAIAAAKAGLRTYLDAVKEAAEAAKAAQEAAEAAKDAAEAAKAEAETILADAKAAEEAANAAQAEAEAAKAEAQAAETAAKEAEAKAEEAKAAAEAAQASAAEDKASAEAAAEAAKEAEAKAEEAKAAAEAAKAEAIAAESEAKAAKEAAETAKAEAIAAESEAKAAETGAKEAEAKAEEAKGAAEEAAKAAEESNQEAAAEAAKAAASAADAAEDAKKATESAANAVAEAGKAAEAAANAAKDAGNAAADAAAAAKDSKTAADAAKEASDYAAQAAEALAKAQAAQEGAEKAEKAAEDAEKAAEDAQKKAEEAQKKADDAANSSAADKEAAEKAKAEAEAAKKAAEAAKAAAEAAKKEAEEAKAEAEVLLSAAELETEKQAALVKVKLYKDTIDTDAMTEEQEAAYDAVMEAVIDDICNAKSKAELEEILERMKAEVENVLNPAKERFEDVGKADWFYDEVNQVAEDGYMTGMDETHFGPYESLSRAQFALILYRIEGEPEFETEKEFLDISGDEWYGQAVLWAAEAGIVTGYLDGNFGPVDNITREQMAVMMYRYAKYLEKDVTKTADISTFKDADSVSEFAEEAFAWANGNSIITGKEEGTLLAPQQNTARAEAAAIINRFIHE